MSVSSSLIATGAPCTSIFKPIWFSSLKNLPLRELIGPEPTEHFDQNSLWWRHEILYRSTAVQWERLSLYKHKIEEMEEKFYRETELQKKNVDSNKTQFIVEAFKEADEAERKWIQLLHEHSKSKPAQVPILYGIFFNQVNSCARIVSHLTPYKYHRQQLIFVVLLLLVVLDLVYVLLTSRFI